MMYRIFSPWLHLQIPHHTSDLSGKYGSVGARQHSEKKQVAIAFDSATLAPKNASIFFIFIHANTLDQRHRGHRSHY